MWVWDEQVPQQLFPRRQLLRRRHLLVPYRHARMLSLQAMVLEMKMQYTVICHRYRASLLPMVAAMILAKGILLYPSHH